jgi:hypothetical protein
MDQRIDDSVFGRLPEMQRSRSDGIHIPSLMMEVSGPEWAFFDRREPKTIAVDSRSKASPSANKIVAAGWKQSLSWSAAAN